MSLVDWLLGRKAGNDGLTAAAQVPTPPATNEGLYEFDACGDFELAVVGESNYLDTLLDARARLMIDDEGDRVLPVRLECEPTNRHDPNAVRVATIAGDTIGYLSRDDAEDYCEVLTALGGSVICKAELRGGTPGKPHIGAWLYVMSPEELEDAKPRR